MVEEYRCWADVLVSPIERLRVVDALEITTTMQQLKSYAFSVCECMLFCEVVMMTCYWLQYFLLIKYL